MKPNILSTDLSTAISVRDRPFDQLFIFDVKHTRGQFIDQHQCRKDKYNFHETFSRFTRFHGWGF